MMLVIAIQTPEIFVLFAYLALCWLCFSNYIDSFSMGMNERDSKINGTLVFRCIFTILLVTHIILITLYLAQVIAAQILLIEMIALEIIMPVCVVVIIMYYQCKFSGLP